MTRTSQNQDVSWVHRTNGALCIKGFWNLKRLQFTSVEVLSVKPV